MKRKLTPKNTQFPYCSEMRWQEFTVLCIVFTENKNKQYEIAMYVIDVFVRSVIMGRRIATHTVAQQRFRKAPKPCTHR